MPPYPTCLEDITLNQNIINCDGVVSLWDSLYHAENIIELDFSNAGLSGNIPIEIGYFTNLDYLIFQTIIYMVLFPQSWVT